MSIKYRLPVLDLIMSAAAHDHRAERLCARPSPSSVGIPLGIISAYRRNSAADAGTMAFANIGVSIPVFVLGLLLAYLFAIVLKGTPFALPPSGRLSPGVRVESLVTVWGLQHLDGPGPDGAGLHVQHLHPDRALTFQWNAFVDAFRHLILPAIALGTIPLAIIARITRSSLLEVMGRDYVRTARAKGLADWAVLRKHAFRNAILPIVTIIGLQIGILLSGAVLTESVFGLAGMGTAVTQADHDPGLHGHPGLHPGHRRPVPAREPAGRCLICVARPARPAELMPTIGTVP